MKVLLSILFFATIGVSSQAWSETQPKLTLDYIWGHFPLCQVDSSLGQTCKTFTAEEAYRFSPSQITNIVSKEILDDSMNIETEDWRYSFKVSESAVNTYEILFTDNGIQGSYNTAVIYNVVWDKGQHNWYIVGETINFIDDNDEDKKNEGAYLPKKNPVGFIQDE